MVLLVIILMTPVTVVLAVVAARALARATAVAVATLPGARATAVKVPGARAPIVTTPVLPRAGTGPAATPVTMSPTLQPKTVLVFTARVVSRAQRAERGDRSRHNGARLDAHRHAIDGAQVPRWEGVRGRPEVDDRLTAVKHRRPGEIFNTVYVQQDPEGDAPFPLIRHVLFDVYHGGKTHGCLVDESAP